MLSLFSLATLGFGSIRPPPECPLTTQQLVERERAKFTQPNLINGLFPPNNATASTGDYGYSERYDPASTDCCGGVTFTQGHAQRKAGERTPVHMHPDPQFSCVRQGRVLVQIEGHEDKVYEPGECYLMPPNTKMAPICVSPDGEDCIIEDIFRVPDCSTSWVVLEPSMYYLQDQFSQELGA